MPHTPQPIGEGVQWRVIHTGRALALRDRQAGALDQRAVAFATARIATARIATAPIPTARIATARIATAPIATAASSRASLDLGHVLVAQLELGGRADGIDLRAERIANDP